MSYVPPEINGYGLPLAVARDPGQIEVDEGRPLVGDSGRLLFGGWMHTDSGSQHTTGLMDRSGRPRHQWNITNRVLYKPWNNDFSLHKASRIVEGWDDLLNTVERTNPPLIVAMGNEASYDLVPGWDTLAATPTRPWPGGRTIWSAKDIFNRRGYIWRESTLGPPVLATLHPASCLYQPVPSQLLLGRDLERAGMFLRGELPFEEFPQAELLTPYNRDELYESEIVAFDIEVYGDGAEFLCIAFCTDKGKTYVSGSLTPWVQDILADEDVVKLAHNKAFDTHYLKYKVGVEVNGCIEDTMILHWAMYPELAGRKEMEGEEIGGKKRKGLGGMTRKSLSFLASWYLNVPFWKEYTTDVARMHELCARDTYATMRCWQEMHPLALADDVLDTYALHRDMVPALTTMQFRGMRVDEKLRRARVRTLTARFEALMFDAREYGLAIIKKEDYREFFEDKRCSCCKRGPAKLARCWSCAGFESSPKKPDLVALARSQGKDVEGLLRRDLERLCLAPCTACGGTGDGGRFEFNAMSPSQMVALLTLLGVPKYVWAGDVKADEDTLKRVLEWARS